MSANVLTGILHNRLAQSASLCRAELSVTKFIHVEITRACTALPYRSLALQKLLAVLVLDEGGWRTLPKEVLPEIETVGATDLDHSSFIVNQINRDEETKLSKFMKESCKLILGTFAQDDIDMHIESCQSLQTLQFGRYRLEGFLNVA